jgi:glycerol-3-phosphate acyltransferase PlsY
METYVREIALIAAAYALGCVSTGYYLVRLRSGDDVRNMGSGNIGARNVGRVLGKWGLAVTLAGDTAKGAIPVAAALLLDMEPWAVMAVVFAAVAGHLWPAQLGLKGGKGLATTMGAILVLDFRLVLAAFVIAGIAWLFSRNATGSGLVAVVLTPLAAIVARHDSFTVAALAVLAAAIVLAHRANLQAILAGIRTPSGEEA